MAADAARSGAGVADTRGCKRPKRGRIRLQIVDRVPPASGDQRLCREPAGCDRGMDAFAALGIREPRAVAECQHAGAMRGRGPTPDAK